MKIEVGKWYKTRSGHKAFVAARTSGAYSLYGHVETGADIQLDIWTESGRVDFDDSDQPMDLVAPWIDKPIVDWSKERPWVKAIARDENGDWFRYDAQPTVDAQCGIWKLQTAFHTMHTSEYPTNPDGSPWTGDWKESLVVRPEGGAK